MTLNIDKEYPGDVEFDYEAIARQVVELLWILKTALMRRR